MSDGHSGIENKKLNEGESGGFHAVLAALKQADGETDWVIHVTSRSRPTGREGKFLEGIGLTPHSGQCIFHGDSCFYAIIGRVIHDANGWSDARHVRQVHHTFREFAKQVGRLFDLHQQQADILGQIGIELPGGRLFGPPAKIALTEAGVPHWVDAVKFPALRTLEGRRDALEREIARLAQFLPLLYGTGDALRDAVVAALRFLGLQAEPTQPSFTVDIVAETKDGSRRFGIEVTGISGAIKKESKKLTQVLEFERVKQQDEKTILLANTHHGIPALERRDLEDFTQPVLDFLASHPILLMTGWDLYRLVGDVLEDRRTKEEVIEVLYNTSGRLAYNS